MVNRTWRGALCYSFIALLSRQWHSKSEEMQSGSQDWQDIQFHHEGSKTPGYRASRPARKQPYDERLRALAVNESTDDDDGPSIQLRPPVSRLSLAEVSQQLSKWSQESTPFSQSPEARARAFGGASGGRESEADQQTA